MDLHAISWIQSTSPQAFNAIAYLGTDEASRLDTELDRLAGQSAELESPVVTRAPERQPIELEGAEAAAARCRDTLQDAGCPETPLKKLDRVRDDAANERGITAISWTFTSGEDAFTEMAWLTNNEARQLNEALDAIARESHLIAEIGLRTLSDATPAAAPRGLEETAGMCARTLLDQGVDPDLVAETLGTLAPAYGYEHGPGIARP